ncbi:MAG: hypothetical protein PVF69_06005 [Gemmatimonadota bacterium]
MLTILRRFALVCILLSTFSCGGARVAVDTQQTYYLQYNLRAHGREITSINEFRYQTVVPMCTPVKLIAARGRRIVFDALGQRYRYTIHRSSRIPLMTHLNRTFASPCPDISTMSAIDQQGIRTATPLVGMSKQGVVFALGYPPDHKTPTLDQSPWTYWGLRGEVQVHFNGDVVSQVTGNPSEPAVIAAAQTLPPPTQQVQQQQQQQTVPVTEEQGGSDEVMVVVTDPNGYPAQVPQSAIGQPCDAQTPCHQALVCTAGTCQPVAQQ